MKYVVALLAAVASLLIGSPGGERQNDSILADMQEEED